MVIGRKSIRSRIIGKYDHNNLAQANIVHERNIIPSVLIDRGDHSRARQPFCQMHFNQMSTDEHTYTHTLKAA